MRLLEDTMIWTWTDVFIGWFFGFIIHQEFNIAWRIKRMLNYSPSKYIKLIDCYPCFTFWTALIITQSVMASIISFFLATYLDKK